ncbi:cytochrome c oxidase subunit 3 [Thiogranum longum]|uniref:cytochrome-c oxidase n=1 Tax=Thiogranum longum TaxID=1537524 RepID=A0A4R1HCX1_9GAMM|nr:cytochrome c oxidase subunit 3 [Thiogranum longum]TCK17079.1 cytochrome c oxidase subunit 3 [Thiogranum longum]
MSEAHGGYYVPHGTSWPIIGSIGLTTLVVGFANFLNGSSVGMTMMLAGLGITLLMMFGWFGTVIRESQAGMYNEQVDKSFRWGMSWFIFSEVMFFAAFFGALYYARVLSVPWLGGADVETNEFLWSGWEAAWPTNGPGDMGGEYEAMGAWGIPAINTLLLLSSGVTITFAHWALKKGQRSALVLWLLATVVLGFTFLGFQIYEYSHAYHEMNLTLASGIYGSTFYMLTGFHGMHVTIGAIMLTIIMLRSMKGHFTADHHFAFEAVAWYWHFVDVVWLGLFIFVYVL